jgi:hypothetical protein
MNTIGFLLHFVLKDPLNAGRVQDNNQEKSGFGPYYQIREKLLVRKIMAACFACLL